MSDHTGLEIEKAFSVAPKILSALGKAGVRYPRLTLYADASGKLTWEGALTPDQFELASRLLFSRRFIGDSLHWCCGLVQRGREGMP